MKNKSDFEGSGNRDYDDNKNNEKENSGNDNNKYIYFKKHIYKIY